MIISHRHKFIFIKPHKTAGTSVELLLSRLCGPDDIITPFGFDPDSNIRKKHQAKHPQNYYRPKPLKHWQLNEVFWFLTKGRKPNLNFIEHLTASKIRQYVGEEIWANYLKISIVRNPWTHAISQFNWMRKYKFGGVTNDFLDFIKYRYKTQWPFYSSFGEYDIDFILRFEDLENDIERLFEKLNIQEEKINLPKTKINSDLKSTEKEYYNVNSFNIVRFKNLLLLEVFGYTYDYHGNNNC